MKKILLYIIGLFSVLFALVSCKVEADADVVVSFYALEELTNELVKDTNISVKTLIDGASEPHDFEPSAKSVSSMYSAKVLIFNGNGLEEFESSLDNELKSKIVYATSDVESINVNGSRDPHAFASPKQLKIMLNTIKDALIKEFSTDSKTITNNYTDYLRELDLVDTMYTELFSDLTKKIVVGHEAFNYVARDYNYQFSSVNGMNEEEPTAKKILEIQNYIKDNNIQTIYGEHYEENETIESIASEMDIKVEYLYTLEMMEDCISLIDALKNNVNTLKK